MHFGLRASTVALISLLLACDPAPSEKDDTPSGGKFDDVGQAALNDAIFAFNEGCLSRGSQGDHVCSLSQVDFFEIDEGRDFDDAYGLISDQHVTIADFTPPLDAFERDTFERVEPFVAGVFGLSVPDDTAPLAELVTEFLGDEGLESRFAGTSFDLRHFDTVHILYNPGDGTAAVVQAKLSLCGEQKTSRIVHRDDLGEGNETVTFEVFQFDPCASVDSDPSVLGDLDSELFIGFKQLEPLGEDLATKDLLQRGFFAGEDALPTWYDEFPSAAHGHGPVMGWHWEDGFTGDEAQVLWYPNAGVAAVLTRVVP